jgi:uncharacterized protein
MKPTDSNSQPTTIIPFQILLGTVVVTSITLFLGIHFMKKSNAVAATQENFQSHTNRLASEKSPYLLQHAHNPVDWYPWGKEAFEKARSENKMIFLSIGYSTCHWCHVMAHESFENEDIAKVMNEYFVCVKLDREERPDVDKIYMTFVQATTGSGGWPMSVWLTPDLKPVVGGTYFPPESKFGRPGFPDICKQIGDAWKNDRQRLIDSGNEVINKLREAFASNPSSAQKLDPSVLDKAYSRIASQYDEENKGFGAAPKFPRPVTFNFLLRQMNRKGKSSTEGAEALSMTLETLDVMAKGGIHDHLGGGFHRYAVDKNWHVPHFEKMLYDQAQLTISYLEAYQITRKESYAEVARDILDYVLTDMTSPGGGFYSAEDADSVIEHGKPDHAEGAFYVWTPDEVKSLLGEEKANWFNAMYGVVAGGNAPMGSDPHGEFKNKNILIQRMDAAEVASKFKTSTEVVEEAIDEARSKLKTIRDKRPRPHLDDKVITAWNGLMISAFAKAGQALSDGGKYGQAAIKAASFIRDEMYDASHQTLYRIHRGKRSDIKGFLDDHAFMIQGLLDLYETTFDIQWVEWAAKLQERQDALFLDTEHGGYFGTEANTSDILLRMKDDYDGAEPSANSIAVMNLLRLNHMLGDNKALEKAESALGHFSVKLNNQPSGMPQMLVALDHSLHPTRQIVFAAEPSSSELSKMKRQLHHRFIPGKVVLLADGGNGQAFLAKSLEFIQSVSRIDNKATAYVCEDYVCQRPTNDLEAFIKLLAP